MIVVCLGRTRPILFVCVFVCLFVCLYSQPNEQEVGQLFDYLFKLETGIKLPSHVSNCAGVYRLEHNYIVRYIKISQLNVSALMGIFRLGTRLD